MSLELQHNTNSHEHDLIFNCRTSQIVMQKCIDAPIKTKKKLKNNTTNNKRQNLMKLQ
jgi:hypothetical protein